MVEPYHETFQPPCEVCLLLGDPLPLLLLVLLAVMSSNGEHSTVLRGVTHGAVDFLIKPVRIEELRNIWQHVIRRSGRHAASSQVRGPGHCDIHRTGTGLGPSTDCGGSTASAPMHCSRRQWHPLLSLLSHHAVGRQQLSPGCVAT